ncbi:MAG: phosphocholine cytidylyltransferase family protein [Planctomycetota bacterium]|jgi:choline kinase
MKEIRKAIILVAGGGLRLRPMTDHVPKCLVQINNKSILVNALENLQDNGISETLLVVGYKSEQIKETIGNCFRGMKIAYCQNSIYDKTNNIYSLYLARDRLREGVILLEGDVFFEEKILKELLGRDEEKTYWVVDKFTEELDGCMLTTDEDNRIVGIRIVREKLPEYKDNFFKSVGMLKITSDFGRAFEGWLEREIESDVRDVYYDLVLAKHIKERTIYICDINGSRWAEIDTQEDLDLAEKRMEHISCRRR